MKKPQRQAKEKAEVKKKNLIKATKATKTRILSRKTVMERGDMHEKKLTK